MLSYTRGRFVPAVCDHPRMSEEVEIQRPPILYDQTQPVLRALEEQTGKRVLTYWMGPSVSMKHDDVVALHDVLERLDAAGGLEQTLLLIKSEGGAGTVALRLANVLRERVGHLVAAIPLECASAATMLALGADEIHMGPLGYLTAVDTSIRHELSPVNRHNALVAVSQDELTRVVRLWQEQAPEDADENPYANLFKHVHPLVIGAVDRASSLSVKLCREILAYHLEDEARADAISKALNNDYPSHNYPITLREGRRIGLDVRTLDPGWNSSFIELCQRYAEMGQRADTDYDEHRYHSNEIQKIIEGNGVMLYYQQDKDWVYRKEERRWSSMHNKSGWRRLVGESPAEPETFHVR